VNQAAQAFAKSADPEYGRAGGKLAATETEHRFPDLVALLEKIAEERRLRAAEGGPAQREVPPDSDPRWRRLKAMGQA